mgnify:CR=1 FL=1
MGQSSIIYGLIKQQKSSLVVFIKSMFFLKEYTHRQAKNIAEMSESSIDPMNYSVQILSALSNVITS